MLLNNFAPLKYSKKVCNRGDENDSSTVLEREDSAEKFPARHPIFQLVRPAVVVGCLYILLIGLDFLINHHNALYYVHIGPRFVLHDPHAKAGYDGQFYYQIARDPLHAAPFLDKLPTATSVSSILCGRCPERWTGGLIPYMLLLVNFVSIVLGTELFARLLSKKNLSPGIASPSASTSAGHRLSFRFNRAADVFPRLPGTFSAVPETSHIRSDYLGPGSTLARDGYAISPRLHRHVSLSEALARRVSYFSPVYIPTVAWYFIVGQHFHTNGLSGVHLFELIPFRALLPLQCSARVLDAHLSHVHSTLLSIFLAVNEVFNIAGRTFLADLAP